MAQKRTRIRIKTADDGATEVFAFIMHPMETGLRTDAQTKTIVPAHFIQRIVFSLNDEAVATLHTGIAVSANPLVSVRLTGATRGDKVQVSWSDNRGDSDTEATTIGEGS